MLRVTKPSYIHLFSSPSSSLFPICVDEGAEVHQERRFFQALGSRGPIRSAETGGDDEEFEEGKMKIESAIRTLYW